MLAVSSFSKDAAVNEAMRKVIERSEGYILDKSMEVMEEIGIIVRGGVQEASVGRCRRMGERVDERSMAKRYGNKKGCHRYEVVETPCWIARIFWWGDDKR